MTSVFINSDMLRLLVLIPLLILLFAFAAFKRRKTIALLMATKLSEQLIDPACSRKRRITEFCLITAFALTILGLARPTWYTEHVLHPKTGRDLVFLLDISQSMLAEDQPPSRLICAKNSILQCLDEFNTGRVGLVVFAGATSIRCPLTRDFDFFRSTLDELTPDSVPVGGTRIGDAIIKTVEKVLTDEEADYRDIILITDGGDQASINTNSLAKLADSEARLIIIGLGSDTIPAVIPIKDANTGKVKHLTYRDKIVRTKQHPETLRKITEKVPNSIYMNVGTSPLDLADIYKTHIAATLRDSTKELSAERPKEQYWRFLLAALAFLAASFLPWCRSSKLPTRSALRSSFSAARVSKPKFLALLLLLTSSTLMAESRDSLFGKGVSAYNDGEFESAVENFYAAEKKNASPVIDYNLASSYYRQGNMQNALWYFERAAETTSDDSLSVNARYNMGNSMFKMAFSEETAEKETAISLIKQSIATYTSVLLSDSSHVDALYNVGIAKQFLEHLEKTAQQSDDKNDGSEERDVDDETATQESDSADSSNAMNPSSEEDEKEEQAPPNLTPEEIIKEEEKNKLTRSRKKHADFAKTEKNW